VASYLAAVQEQIEAAIRLEPGVLVLYAVAHQDNPARVIVFEIYRDTEAYRAHLHTEQSDHREDGDVAQAGPHRPDRARREAVGARSSLMMMMMMMMVETERS
jgi:hypothetical protein